MLAGLFFQSGAVLAVAYIECSPELNCSFVCSQSLRALLSIAPLMVLQQMAETAITPQQHEPGASFIAGKHGKQGTPAAELPPSSVVSYTYPMVQALLCERSP